jgi:hypothetical protein
MSNLQKFVLNRAGVRELMKSQEMIDVLTEFAGQVATNAGEGYSVHTGPNRANVSVATDTDEAYYDNLDNNTLEKSIR